MDEYTRKIVQVSFSGSSAGAALYALCNDGTLWLAPVYQTSAEWEQILPIPQVGKGRYE